MKKSLIAILVATILVPQIAFAAWWNPLSWFDNWSFFKSDRQEPEVAILEERVQELEDKLQELATSTATTTPEENTNVPVQETSQMRKSTPNPIPIATPTPVVEMDTFTPKPEDFRAVCEVSRAVINEGETIDATIEIYFDRSSLYEIEWYKNPTKEEKHGKAQFKFNTPSNEIITATVTRISDRYSKVVTCPLVIVEEVFIEDYDSEQEPLVEIISDVDQWITTHILLKEDTNNVYDNLDEFYIIDTYGDNVISQVEQNAKSELERLADLLSLHAPAQTVIERVDTMINYSQNVSEHERIVDFLTYWEAWKEQF